MMALVLASVSLILALSLALATVTTLLDFVRRHALRMTPDAIKGIRGLPDGLRLTYASGDVVDAILVAPIVVTPGFVSFGLRTPGGRCQVPVFADAMSPNAFRRLRVYLKLANHEGSAPVT
ncbi:MAG: protein YgfX [Gammaproteobacteria bacterium]|nr:protein YgfX [Gammaproteobacteria bacterium]